MKGLLVDLFEVCLFCITRCGCKISLVEALIYSDVTFVLASQTTVKFIYTSSHL